MARLAFYISYYRYLYGNAMQFRSSLRRGFIFVFCVAIVFCCVMSGVKVANAKKSVLKVNVGIISNQVPDVSFGSNGNVIVYLIDKKGLEKFLKKNDSVDVKIANEQVRGEDFKAEKNQILDLGYNKQKKVILVGIDKMEDGKSGNKNKTKNSENISFDFEVAGAKMYCYLPKGKQLSVVISGKYLENKEFKDDNLLLMSYFGLAQRAYKFDKYITDEKAEKQKITINKVLIDANATSELKSKLKDLNAQLEGIFLVRDLGNEPANVVYPESFAKTIQQKFKNVKNVKVKVLDLKELKKLGMNMLIGVAQGSVKEPKVVVVEYKGNKSSDKFDLGLVGKGVCFDSGGLSLKPSPYMEGMKGDMIGAGTIMSSVYSLAKMGAKVNVVAVGGLVENMPSGSAQKVGDIVKSMSGKTVEIIDTDAEGRLVLGDVLYYTQTKYKPKYLIDMATLTGAIMVALGQSMSGIFSNSDALANALKNSGDNTGDKCWIMPMGEEFSENMKSNVADLRNLSKVRYGGSATAGAFLENFIADSENWAHIDIAGVDFATSRSIFADADTATGYGVKLIVDYVYKNLVK